MKHFYALAACLILYLNAPGIHCYSTTEEKLLNAINDFTLKFYKELIKTQKENVICSGFSLHILLNMLLTGARFNTATEIDGTLGYNKFGVSQGQSNEAIRQLLFQLQANHSGYDLEVANSIWIQSGFSVLPDFNSIIKNNFFVENKQLDFGNVSAKDQINAWVREKTGGRIPTLFDEPLDPLTRLVLANAVYFKGRWAKQFNKEKTTIMDFVSKDGTKAIPMMNIYENFSYTQNEDFHTLEIPYIGNDVSMTILLPKSIDGLETVEKNLDLESLKREINGLEPKKVHVKIPRFSINSKLPLNRVLNSMGIVKAFSKSEADLSGIDGEKNLYVSDSIQKADIEVNEDGTVAAAAAGAAFAFRSFNPSDVYFAADHPFLFFIRQKSTGLLLFIGRVAKL